MPTPPRRLCRGTGTAREQQFQKHTSPEAWRPKSWREGGGVAGMPGRKAFVGVATRSMSFVSQPFATASELCYPRRFNVSSRVVKP